MRWQLKRGIKQPLALYPRPNKYFSFCGRTSQNSTSAFFLVGNLAPRMCALWPKPQRLCAPPTGAWFGPLGRVWSQPRNGWNLRFLATWHGINNLALIVFYIFCNFVHQKCKKYYLCLKYAKWPRKAFAFPAILNVWNLFLSASYWYLAAECQTRSKGSE